MRTDFPQFTLMNIYFPNGGSGLERLAYKLGFYDAFLGYTQALRSEGKRLMIYGDYNTAHREIDLARPEANERTSGCLPEERALLDRMAEQGDANVYRHLHKEPGRYTWWDQKTFARDRNVGWRIDYFLVSGKLRPRLKEAFIRPSVTGSDHCPVGITLE